MSCKYNTNLYFCSYLNIKDVYQINDLLVCGSN